MIKGRYYMLNECLNPYISKYYTNFIGCIFECQNIDNYTNCYVCKLIDDEKVVLVFNQFYNTFKELTISDIRKIKLERLNKCM